jgi:D-tyrosyl-tRNA(Tyr) deacylase
LRALLQRVLEARVRIDGEVVGEIGPGLLVFVGVEAQDTGGEIPRLVERVLGQRIFPDAGAPDRPKPMNASLLDVGGQALLVSQFTLAADTSRGRRPGFSTAAPPERAEPLFDAFVHGCREVIGDPARIATGRFGADMKVELVNDGPVTFLLESPRA